MIFSEKEGYEFNDVKRRIANLIRLGYVKHIDFEKANARIQIGNLLTDWLPWITRCAGNTVNWCPLEVGEQVVVLATTGDLCQGVILGSLYRLNAPSTSPTLHTMHYNDGSSLSFDTATSQLTANIKGDAIITTNGNATVTASSSVNITAGNKATVTANVASIKAPTITLDGDVTITGSLIGEGTMTLAGDGRPVARLGDSVSVDSESHQGSITSGSSKVTAG